MHVTGLIGRASANSDDSYERCRNTGRYHGRTSRRDRERCQQPAGARRRSLRRDLRRGWARLDRACAELDGCATGDAVVTRGFRLPARWIVHTVGPVWHGGHDGEPELLAACYRRSIEVAAAAGARSLAFPAISTGIFGYPPGPAAQIAIDTVVRHGADLDLIRLVAFDADTYARYEALLAASS